MSPIGLVAARREGQLKLYEVAATDAEIISYGMIDGGGAKFCSTTPVGADGRAAVQDAMDAGGLRCVQKRSARWKLPMI